MNLIFVLCLFLFKEIKDESSEYYNCLDPYKIVNTPSDCLSIVIPDSDGYKCCSMEISFLNKTSYNCAPIESNFTKTKEDLEKYMTKRSLAPFFSNNGGMMKIDCGDEMNFTKEYMKLSDEFNNCYFGHINGAIDENDCIENNISTFERRCCFVESSKKNNGTINDDKRCHMIKDEYFSVEKSLNNYLLDEFNVKNLNEVRNINLTIKCKNYSFHFISEDYSETETKIESEAKGLQGGIIAIIIISIIIFILIAAFLIYRWIRKKRSESNDITVMEKFIK